MFQLWQEAIGKIIISYLENPVHHRIYLNKNDQKEAFNDLQVSLQGTYQIIH